MRLASGETIVAVSVTEPDIGSDTANVQTRAEPAEYEGQSGWRINGAKAWCTFAGRADVLQMTGAPTPRAGVTTNGPCARAVWTARSTPVRAPM